jgi:hypothetical protein
MRNMHPADELAYVRRDIKRLQEREAQLRQGILNGVLPRRGAEVEIEVKPVRRRVFLRDNLPPDILNNDSYWRTEVTPHLLVSALPSYPAPFRTGASGWAGRRSVPPLRG